jgi:N-acetylmuramoyl-L-alanine amidase
MRNPVLRLLLSAAVCCIPLAAQEGKIPAGAKVFVAPMNGFETYLKAALDKKRVPVTVVENRDKADFEISGSSESQKASTAKKVIMLNWHSNEQASIKVTDIKSGVVVFAYSAYKASSAHGKQSSAEACAKHLKEKIKAK